MQQLTIDTLLAIAGIVTGLLAMAMAAPPLLQMLFGRPKLLFEFVDFTGTSGKNLICSIKNEPVRSRFLKFTGVRRETGEINASFSIVEMGTGKHVAMAISAMMNDATARKLDLVASARPHFHVGFPVIHCRPEGPIVYDPRRDEAIKVPGGQYVAKLVIVCGDRPHIMEKPFSAHPDPMRTFWI